MDVSRLMNYLILLLSNTESKDISEDDYLVLITSIEINIIGSITFRDKDILWTQMIWEFF